jgi:hypothetical protein
MQEIKKEVVFTLWISLVAITVYTRGLLRDEMVLVLVDEARYLLLSNRLFGYTWREILDYLSYR